jgi:hypothetical protein
MASALHVCSLHVCSTISMFEPAPVSAASHLKGRAQISIDFIIVCGRDKDKTVSALLLVYWSIGLCLWCITIHNLKTLNVTTKLANS